MSNDPLAALRQWLHRFGRPDRGTASRVQHGETLAAFDSRLTDVEREQREIEARLRLLEIQGTPRGRLRDR